MKISKLGVGGVWGRVVVIQGRGSDGCDGLGGHPSLVCACDSPWDLNVFLFTSVVFERQKEAKADRFSFCLFTGHMFSTARTLSS